MDIVDRLLSRIKVTPAGCFEWQGCRRVKGYGSINVSGFSKLAHRASYEAFRKPIPAGLLVCHHCDNPCCINPAHLFVGTALDNSMDCIRKKRNRHLKGEEHPNAVLQSIDIIMMRRDRQNGTSLYRLAKRYGVTVSHVQLIIERKAWKHIP